MKIRNVSNLSIKVGKICEQSTGKRVAYSVSSTLLTRLQVAEQQRAYYGSRPWPDFWEIRCSEIKKSLCAKENIVNEITFQYVSPLLDLCC